MEPEKYKLGNIVEFSSGILLPRITDTIDDHPSRRIIYNPLSESPKYVHGESDLPVITEKQIAISMLQREAYLVSSLPQIDEQILTANFVSVTLGDRLDRQYFVWWFNHSIEAQRQLEATGQLGRRVVLKDLRELTISIPDLSLQQDVGNLSVISHQQSLALKEQAHLVEERALQFIRQKMISEG